MPGLVRLVAFTWEHAGRVAIVVLVLTSTAGIYTAATLRIQSDNVRLVSAGLPFRRAFEKLTRDLPVLNRSLVVLVDADTPTTARDGADALASSLVGKPGIQHVFQPGGGEFFRHNGLLYLDLDEIDALTDKLARMQPILLQLERKPAIGPLAEWARELLVRAGDAPEARELWVDLFDRLRAAATAAREGRIEPTDWSHIQGTTIGGSSNRAVIFVEPRADYGRLAAAGQAMSTIRREAAALAPRINPAPRVRITGYPALAYEEMQGLLEGAIGAGIASLVLAAFFLRLALRSWRLVAAGTLTLLVGLILTAGFATLAIGSLNIVSVLFAVLFIGLGVDFAIHLGVRYLDAYEGGLDHRAANCAAAERVGSALILCAATTAIGFYSFVPTDYKGVAELGLISGTGMIIIFLLSFSFFPSLLALGLRPHSRRARVESSVIRRLSLLLQRHARWVRIGGMVLGLTALALIPRVRFDANVIKMRDPRTESVQAFEDLLAEPGLGSPWYIDVLADNPKAAERMADRLEPLECVDRVISLHDWVPPDQNEKVEILRDAALLLEAPPTSDEASDDSAVAPRPALEALQRLLQDRASHFEDPRLRTAAASLAIELRRFLEVARGEDEPRKMAALRTNMIGDLTLRLDQLRQAFSATPFGVEDLPPGLLQRMRTPDGRIRVQVFPSEDLSDPAAWARFADGVREVEPQATGLSINLLEFGRVTVVSLREASLIALVGIVLLLSLLGHRDQLLYVLVPLMWAALATAGATVLLGIELNFANVVVLPLLLGIGVDSAIHLVLRWGDTGSIEVLTTSTARAVGYSALTTASSFGSLAFSANRGISSLGILLVVGLAFTLLASLVLLPATLASQDRPDARA